MIKTPRHLIELEIPGARRITEEIYFNASAQGMAGGNGNVKGIPLYKPQA